MSTRIYLSKDKETGKERLVRGLTQQSVRNHVYNSLLGNRIEVDVAKQADLERLLTAGVKVEKAGEEPAAANGQQADLEQQAAIDETKAA